MSHSDKNEQEDEIRKNFSRQNNFAILPALKRRTLRREEEKREGTQASELEGHQHRMEKKGREVKGLYEIDENKKKVNKKRNIKIFGRVGVGEGQRMSRRNYEPEMGVKDKKVMIMKIR